MTLPRPVRIVGSGSDWGDDALAWEVIAQLRLQVGERPDLELFAVHGIEQILGLLDARGTLIIIDAVLSGAPAGTIHRFDWPDRRLRPRRGGSTHGLDAGTVLDLAAALGVLPARVVVFGLEAQCGEAPRAECSQLSGPVRAAVPELVRRIAREVASAPALVKGCVDGVLC